MSMGIWREHFSWEILSRWDFLGVIIPGFPIAIGLAMLSTDWFPKNLLISQACFGGAAAILSVKFVAISFRAKSQSLLSRVVFSILACIVLITPAYLVIVGVQKHKIEGEENKERSALFRSVEDFLSKKTEYDLRETFDIPTIERDAILEAKEQLTPNDVSQSEKDTLARDEPDGQKVVFRRYVQMEGNHITPAPGKSGFLLQSYKSTQARKKLAGLYSSALIPLEVAQPLKEFDRALSDNQEILMDTINESYAANSRSISMALTCSIEECQIISNLFYARFIQLKPKAEAVTNSMRTYLESHK